MSTRQKTPWRSCNIVKLSTKFSHTFARDSCCTTELVVINNMAVCRTLSSSRPYSIKCQRMLIMLLAAVWKKSRKKVGCLNKIRWWQSTTSLRLISTNIGPQMYSVFLGDSCIAMLLVIISVMYVIWWTSYAINNGIFITVSNVCNKCKLPRNRWHIESYTWSLHSKSTI